MRIASALGLVFAFVIGLLSLTQVSSLEDSITGATTGPLAVLAEHLTFFWLLIIVLFVVVTLVGFVGWIARR